MLIVATIYVVFLVVSSHLAFSRECPCADSSLCKIIPKTAGKELFVWTLDNHKDVWKQYDWDKITTIAIFHHWDDQLFCYAHSKGVRVVMTASYPTNNLDNDQERYAWVENMTQYAKDNFADGINIDIEGGIAQGSKEVDLLTELVELTASTFAKYIPGSQVTFGVAWTPDCRFTSRCYDYKAIADAVDFLIIMAYDQTGFNSSVAGVNSGYYKNILGIQLYKKLNITADKLVYGVPWYGYDYTCIKTDPNNFCFINCSYSPCRQVSYSVAQDLLTSRSDKGRQDDTIYFSNTPFFSYNDENGNKHQVWYDDPPSLSDKYEYALKYGKMKGIAVWNVDLLDYGGLTRGGHQTKMMWEALPDLKHINGL